MVAYIPSLQKIAGGNKAKTGQKMVQCFLCWRAGRWLLFQVGMQKP